MKNKLFSTIAFCIVSAVVLSVLTLSLIMHADENGNARVVAAQKDATRILIAGMDESAENTDVLLLLSFSHQDGSFNILQIPRDTFVKFEEKDGKINRLYRQFSAENGRKEGAERFALLLSEMLQVEIDLYAVLSMEALAGLVDSMGGIDLQVPNGFEFTDKNGNACRIENGYQHLNGEQALAFVRHRTSYTEGDLGRLDAQMRFIAAIFRRIPTLKFPKQYLDIYQKNLPNLLTNLGEKDIINLMMAYLKRRNELSFHIMRLPGEACLSKEGVWYYVLHQSSASEMLTRYFGAHTGNGFDTAHRFTRENDEQFMNIYTLPYYNYRVYSLDEAQNAKVLHR